MKWYVLLTVGVLASGSALIGLGWQLGPQRPSAPAPVAPHAESEAPDIHMQGVQLVEQTDTTTAFALLAEDAAWYDTTHFAVVNQLRAQLFRNLATPLYVEADQGQVVSTTGDIAIRGRVRLQPREGYTIATEALHWQAASHTLYTDEPVHIQSSTVHITAVGLRSDVDQQRFVLQRDVHASFQLR